MWRVKIRNGFPYNSVPLGVVKNVFLQGKVKQTYLETKTIIKKMPWNGEHVKCVLY